MNAKRESGRRTLAALVVGAALIVGTISGCLGCGGDNYIRMELDREGKTGKPVWVGVYLLSKDNALDGRENAELTNRDTAKTLTAADGVIDSEIRPVYPDEPPVVITREKYDPAVTTVLIVANVPKPDPCARQKVAVKGGSLELKVAVEDKCLTIKGKKD